MQNDPQQWLVEYQTTRYLRKLDEAALELRYRNLSANLWSTDRRGNPIPTRDPLRRSGILRLLVHTEFERMLQSGSSNIQFNETSMREVAIGAYRPPELVKAPTSDVGCFGKFGERDHIAQMFERGLVRISPASSYDDPSLNPAQADRELEHQTITPNKSLLFKLYRLDGDGNEVEHTVEKEHFFEFMNVPNFYVWCCGLGYDARLFHEFEADAACLIFEKQAFVNRLEEAVLKLLPTAKFENGPMNYYDPFTTEREQLIPIFSKDIRFLYQNEYRFAWRIDGDEPLEPFSVELGSLHDIAEYVELK